MVEAGAPGDSHDPPGMLGSPPGQPAGLSTQSVSRRLAVGVQTGPDSHPNRNGVGGKGDRFAIQQQCYLSHLAVIITSFKVVSVQNALIVN